MSGIFGIPRVQGLRVLRFRVLGFNKNCIGFVSGVLSWFRGFVSCFRCDGLGFVGCGGGWVVFWGAEGLQLRGCGRGLGLNGWQGRGGLGLRGAEGG